MSKFYDALLEVLKQDKRFFTEDGTLLRNVVYDAAMKMDQSLISALYANNVVAKNFRCKVKKCLQFGGICANIFALLRAVLWAFLAMHGF